MLKNCAILVTYYIGSQESMQYITAYIYYAVFVIIAYHIMP